MFVRRALFVALLALTAAAASAGGDKTASWSAAWYSPPFPPTANLIYDDVRTYSNQTVRLTVRLEAPGERLRVRVTNAEGLSPLKFDDMHVAIASPNGVADIKTDRTVTFGGKPGAEIPVGQEMLSDPVALKVDRFDHLAISVFYRGRAAPSGHLLKLRISKPGDFAAAEAVPLVGINRAPSIVSGIDVENATPRKVLVAFGDSITEGAGATPGMDTSWPQQFAVRLAQTKFKDWTVVNAGISGNRLLYDGAGLKALERFDRDALSIAGVKAIVLLEGINDIGAGSTPISDTGPRTPADIIGAYKQLIARAHAKGLKIFGATLTPYRGASYFSEDGEKTRLAVNAWIRTSNAFDGIIDFDAATRDPARPDVYRGAYQYGDYLHPGDDGYRTMAAAIDPNLLKKAEK